MRQPPLSMLGDREAPPGMWGTNRLPLQVAPGPRRSRHDFYNILHNLSNENIVETCAEGQIYGPDAPERLGQPLDKWETCSIIENRKGATGRAVCPCVTRK